MEGEELSLKDIKKVWCLFEQSGTFVEEFRKRGKTAFDVDIENRFGKTDIKEDLICSLVGDETPEGSVLNRIRKDDFIMAFFPCTYFTDQSQLASRGESHGMKNWSVERKLNNSVELMWKRAEYYNYFCNLFKYSLDIGCKMVVENPYGRPGFLTQYFPLKPGLVLFDRTEWGDYYRKPTQFFFVGFRPKFWMCEPKDMRVTQKIISKMEKLDGKRIEDVGGFDRSRISPLFADNFIENVFWS